MSIAPAKVYLVFHAERFNYVLEGIFSTREEAEIFRTKLNTSLPLSEESEGDYEVQEWKVDELTGAFEQHSAIKHFTGAFEQHSATKHFAAPGEGTVEPYSWEPKLVAEIEPEERVTYRNGSGGYGVIAHGRTMAEAIAKLESVTE